MVEFNKMFVMIPVMLLARKLDGENPLVVYWLRIAYGCIQLISLAVVIYTYLQASACKADRVVYVPPAPTPFADPNAKKKYTQIEYNAHVLSTARSLVGSTLFGMVMTVGLHWYKGMVMGLAIQTIMAPFNLVENALVKALFLSASRTFRPEDRIFHEKYLNELTADDDVVDEQGNPVTVRRTVENAAAAANTANSISSNVATTLSDEPKTLEDILLDTWDCGSKADLQVLMAAINKSNCNTQTSEDQWSPLMVLSGLGGAKNAASCIRQLIQEFGANPAITDKEGWNALHWAAFHNSIEGATELCKLSPSLLEVKDKDGLTPLETARKEGNETVADLLEKYEKVQQPAAVAPADAETKKVADVPELVETDPKPVPEADAPETTVVDTETKKVEEVPETAEADTEAKKVEEVPETAEADTEAKKVEDVQEVAVDTETKEDK